MNDHTGKRFHCTGRSSAAQVDCAFATDDEAEARRHFEALDHDVEDTALCPECGRECGADHVTAEDLCPECGQPKPCDGGRFSRD